MSKRTYDSVSSKRKKATAKADALRAVIDTTKPIAQFFILPEGPTPQAATDPECRSRLRQDPVFFFRSRCQAKFPTCEISNFTPCTHAQRNILHTKYADKTDFLGLGIRV